MIKARMETSDGKKMILVGISRENVVRLKEGLPIHVSGSDIGVGIDVLLVYSETEESLMKDLEPYMSVEKPQSIN